MPSILANITVATGGRIINTALGLVSTAILARLLGSANYGVYSVLLSFGVMCQVAADFGLYLTLTQKLGQDSSRPGHIISSVVTLRLLLLGGVFIIGVLLTMFLPTIHANIAALAVIYVGLVFQSMSQLCMGIYQVRRSMTAATVGDIVGRLAQIGGLIWILMSAQGTSLQTLSLLPVAVIFALGMLVALATHLTFLPDVRHIRLTRSLTRLKALARESWPLAAMLILNTIYFRIDMIMLPLWRSATEIGLYAIAYRLIENTLFFPAMVGGLLLPHLSAAFHHGKKAHSEQLISQGLRVVAAVAVIAASVFMVVPREIMALIAGPEFVAAAPLLRVLTLALIVMFFGNIFGFTLVAQKQNKFLLKLYCILVVANIVGNYLIIPTLGAMGAALMTLLTEIIACGAAAYKISTTISLKVPRLFAVSLLGYSVGMAALYYFLPTEITGIYRLLVVGSVVVVGAFMLRLVKLSDIPLLAHPETDTLPLKPYAQS